MKTITTTKKQICFSLPTMEDVNFSIECLEEDIQVKGNACASGNDAEDKEIEDSIIEQLNNGNAWAWCTIKVTAKYKNEEGSDYLGCCSYQDEKDFKNDGYYTDMKQMAFDELIRNLESLQD